MLLIIFIILFILFVICKILPDFHWDFWRGVTEFFVSVVCGAGIVIILLVVASSNSLVEVSRQNIKQEIISLQSSNGVNGQFLLGSGFINSSPSYQYFVKTKDGLLKKDSVSANFIYIKQSNEETPHIEWQSIKYRASYWFVWSDSIMSEKDTAYTIVIPENSVIQEFRAN